MAPSSTPRSWPGSWTRPTPAGPDWTASPLASATCSASWRSGRSNASIARELVITEKAVVHHASRIYDVLGLPPSADDHRRVLAVIQYLTNSD